MNWSRSMLGSLGLTAIILVIASVAAPAQPANPQPPDKYKVAVRYRILAPRDQHVAQYKAMVGHLARIGFAFEPKLKPFPNTDYEDPSKNILTGFVPSDQVLRCFEDPSVAALLLMQPDYTAPADPTQPVQVRLELAGGLPQPRQLVLADQTRALLAQLGFQESTGYDHRGYTGKPHTRLVGTIPAEQVESLLKDLRNHPAGWLAPTIDTESLPSPIRQAPPIILTEILGNPPSAADAQRPEKRGQFYLDKISADLWAMLISKDDDTKIVRAEIILSYVPGPEEEGYRAALIREAPSLLIESRLGPIVTAQLRVNQANAIAGLPEVSVVRLARPSMVKVDPLVLFPTDNARALKQSGLEAVHQRGFRGKGIRIGIVDGDFGGYNAMIQNGSLPKNTQYLDLTTSFNPDLLPDSQLGDERAIGHGTHCALAATLAAPEAELTLIRIDPALLGHLQLVAKHVNGELARDDHMARRFEELRAADQELLARRQELISEREEILNNFDDDSEYKRQFEMLGSVVRGWLYTRREWHYHRMAEFERDRENHRRLRERWQRFSDGLSGLKGLDIVSTSLVWNDGYALGGSNPLSRWFDENQQKALWFVSAGNTRGQAWAGPFRDADGNGVMEFATPVSAPLPAGPNAWGKGPAPGSWSSELNFLGWQPHGAAGTPELPKGAKVRITTQWREPHDALYFWRPNEPDRYLKPLANVSFVVLRQRDPSGKVLPADEFEIAARSVGPAFRIENHPTGSTYEQVVEFTVATPGQFALRVERQLPTRWELGTDPTTGRLALIQLSGLAPSGILPLDVPTLPAMQPQWELWPRVFVSVIEPATAVKGRVVFRDFATDQGSIPILADTRSLIAVGALRLGGGPQAFTAVGSPGTLWNFIKPNVLAYDGLALTTPGTGTAFGASLATPFAAGMAATALSAGERPHSIRECLLRLRSESWQVGLPSQGVKTTPKTQTR